MSSAVTMIALSSLIAAVRARTAAALVTAWTRIASRIPSGARGTLEAVLAEDLASGADGVEHVGLGAVFRLAGRVAELDDPLAAVAQHGGQAAAVAGGALDGPGPFGLAAVGIDHVDGVAVAVAGGRELGLCDDAGGVGVDHGERDPVAVGVDTDHVVDEFCKHDGGTSDVSVSVGAGLGGTATPGL